ncbi:MAG: hydrolase [Gammaproteobacteria bacterium]|nr:MAG: hydrolase [Gammaproteobacteria bacterium]
MPRIESPFRPAWWLPGHHLPTLWPALFRRRPRLAIERERLELPDGDFIDLSWHGNRGDPVVLLLHGLEGSLDSHYARPFLETVAREGYRGCLFHFRGCSGEPNRLPRSYHSGDTGDLEQVVSHILESGQRLYAAAGFSLGGNVLLKWLGEKGEAAPLQRAMAVSVPFLLDRAADRLDRGFSRLYQAHLLKSLKRKYREKFSRIPSPLEVDLERIRNFRQWDEEVTAPLHGFEGVDDYYRRCSCRQFIPAIRRPTLILHDRKDPFLWPDAIPTEAELPQQVRLEIARGGGHAGFVQGSVPGLPRYWTCRRLVEWLDAPLESTK